MKMIKPTKAMLMVARELSADTGHSVETCLGAMIGANNDLVIARMQLIAFEPVGCLYRPTFYWNANDYEQAFRDDELDNFFLEESNPEGEVIELVGSFETGRKYYLTSKPISLDEKGEPDKFNAVLFNEDQLTEAMSCYLDALHDLRKEAKK